MPRARNVLRHPQTPQEGPQEGQGILRQQVTPLSLCQGCRRSGRGLRLLAPPQAQVGIPPALDRPDQRGLPRRGYPLRPIHAWADQGRHPVNRKVISELAIHEPDSFKELVGKAKAAIEAYRARSFFRREKRRSPSHCRPSAGKPSIGCVPGGLRLKQSRRHPSSDPTGALTQAAKGIAEPAQGGEARFLRPGPQPGQRDGSSSSSPHSLSRSSTNGPTSKSLGSKRSTLPCLDFQPQRCGTHPLTKTLAAGSSPSSARDRVRRGRGDRGGNRMVLLRCPQHARGSSRP